MTIDFEKDYRKISRDFKGLVELTKRTPKKILENMLVELHDYFVDNYIKVEKENHPEKSTREIIIDMYKLREKLKGREKR